jgi:hypothetical protein
MLNEKEIKAARQRARERENKLRESADVLVFVIIELFVLVGSVGSVGSD